MSIFDPSNARTKTSPSAAEVAGKLFGIKLLLSQLQESGGRPQTFGEYIKSGPRGTTPQNFGALSGDLLSALSQKGAFD